MHLHFAQSTDYLNDIFRFIRQNVSHQVQWDSLEGIIHHHQTQILGKSDNTVCVLPALSCNFVGTNCNQAIPLCASWNLFLLASNVFDDLQDGNPQKHEFFERLTFVEKLSVGIALLGAANASLAQQSIDSEKLRDLYCSLSNTQLLAAYGQSREQGKLSLSQYFQCLTLKAGLPFAVITQAGASLATSDPKSLKAAHDFGLALGMLTQLLDDLRDLGVSNPATGDLVRGHYTLPVIHALEKTEHPLYASLIQLLDKDTLHNHQSVEQVVAILDEMGTLLFCYNVLTEYKQMALSALDYFPADKTLGARAYVESAFQNKTSKVA